MNAKCDWLKESLAKNVNFLAFFVAKLNFSHHQTEYVKFDT